MSPYLFNVISQRNYIFLAQFLSVCVYATVFLRIKETITFKQNRFIFFPQRQPCLELLVFPLFAMAGL